MSDIAVLVDDLGKWYRIGERAHDRTLRQTFSDVLSSTLNARLRRRAPDILADKRKRSQDSIWALRHVSFELRQGELLGIIGINGAGKSTLLKILSQITVPTEGMVEIRGRVRSLLEVGTGFHPELTGRENVYLNGSILGMKRGEIDKKFDEIVAFAEIERFLDTPVKWYSSGMFARLAFSVAAHLEPDVLVVDEVLAVGDAGFQRRCLAKMGTVAASGRTVMFVSHNMQAVSQLTTRCVLLHNGQCCFDGATAEAVRQYVAMQQTDGPARVEYRAPADLPYNHVASAKVWSSHPDGLHDWGRPIRFEFFLEIVDPRDSLCFTFEVLNDRQQPVCHFWLFDADLPYRHISGLFRLQCEIRKFRLYMGAYTLRTWLTDRRSNSLIESLHGICSFEVTMHSLHRHEYDWAKDACAYLEDATWLPVERQ